MSVIELPVRSPEEEELLHPVLAPETANSEPPDTGERRERSFAHGLNFYKLFWVFLIGCFLGVIIELIWCAVLYQKFESRAGLIYGPFNPVYGFGALVLADQEAGSLGLFGQRRAGQRGGIRLLLVPGNGVRLGLLAV